MQIERAPRLAERLHADDYEEDGSALLEHIRRVAGQVEPDVQVVAWLHEVLEWTVVAEHELLMAGLDGEELRALRLLHRTPAAHSDGVYLAHLRLIARGGPLGPAGAGGEGRRPAGPLPAPTRARRWLVAALRHRPGAAHA
jgi:hypothetical protein